MKVDALNANILFTIAALLGVVLANRRMREQPLPTWPALFHGGLAIAGLVALIMAMVKSGLQARVPLALFIIASIGGFVLFAFHLQHRLIPVALMLVHAGVAVLALLLLLLRTHAEG